MRNTKHDSRRVAIQAASHQSPEQNTQQPNETPDAALSSDASNPEPSRGLSAEHLERLQRSAIGDDKIEARRYRTITDASQLRELGFSPSQCRVPGLLLPLWTTDGQNALHVYRPDNPRVVEQKKKGKLADGTYPNRVFKYEVPKGKNMRLDCPPASQPMLADPDTELWITEGQKKADSLASVGLCAIASLGVWNWRGKNGLGGLTVLADWEHIALNGRDVRIVFDSDVMEKKAVRAACSRLTQWLQQKGAHVASVYLPKREDGKCGVDDYLASGKTVDELRSLVEAPRPEPQPAQPIVELLLDEPKVMRRPLMVVDGTAYAATWLAVKRTKTESRTARGQIVRHDPPVVVHGTALFVIRDDGALFSDERIHSAVKPLRELGFEVDLPEILQARHRWSAAAVIPYAKGERPDPARLFSDLVEALDTFIDFDRSFADQLTMCELLACHIMATWVLDALNVIGYIWPNGERGSGKSHLLNVVTQLAHLGEFIIASGSFASLRDLADYGATLGFDDAECYAAGKQSDPDKRALFLAGNRRGATVTLKELSLDKTWVTRYVNAFCPRLFSATELPDEVLASRSIVIPLIQTLDSRKSNIDPADPDVWRIPRDDLKDRLWAFALTALPKIAQCDREIAQSAQLQGRSLQPWRGLLAVAAWLENEAGLPGLRKKLDDLSVSYQSERSQLETGGLTGLAVRALLECASSASPASSASMKGGRNEMFVTTGYVTDKAHRVVGDLELPINTDVITPPKMGRILGRMRLKRGRLKGRGARGWSVSRHDLQGWAARYAIPVPAELGGPETTGASGASGANRNVHGERGGRPVRGSSFQ